MTSIKVKVRPPRIAGKGGAVYYQVIHQRQVRQITTDIRVRPEDWDAGAGKLVPAAAGCGLAQNRIDGDIVLLHRILHDLETRQEETGRSFSVADIVSRFRAPEKHVSVAVFMQEQIGFLTACGRLGTAVNYEKALDCLTGFPGGRELCFSEMTASWVDLYHDYLLCRGLSKNSVSFHMRILRAVYNKAVRREYAVQTFPFRDTFTGVERTRKRAVGEDIIARLVRLDIGEHTALALARDLFLFSFYTRGMAFVDMAYLRRDNIDAGMLCYVRRKTGRPLRVRIETCMREIIERYADPQRPWLFPVMKSEDPVAAYAQYRVSLAYYNRLLKRLSRMIGLEQGLSFYTARHSWATMARNRNVPVAVISAGMGHTSERTTQIYLTSLENSMIDNANKGLLAAFGRIAFPTGESCPMEPAVGVNG